jgi:hypothetical protein
MKASDRFSAGPVRATCACCGRIYEVLNLSLGGMFLAGESHPRVGHGLTIDVSVPAHPAFRVTVSVAWTNAGEEPRAPELPLGFGVRIQNIDMVAKISLLQYLRRIEEQRVR